MYKELLKVVNQNAGAVTAIATVVLALATLFVLRQNRKVIAAANREAASSEALAR